LEEKPLQEKCFHCKHRKKKRIKLVHDERVRNPKAQLDVFLSSLQKTANISFDPPLGKSELKQLVIIAKRYFFDQCLHMAAIQSV